VARDSATVTGSVLGALAAKFALTENRRINRTTKIIIQPLNMRCRVMG
jgi:hypothetical protein